MGLWLKQSVSQLRLRFSNMRREGQATMKHYVNVPESPYCVDKE